MKAKEGNQKGRKKGNCRLNIPIFKAPECGEPDPYKELLMHARIRAKGNRYIKGSLN